MGRATNFALILRSLSSTAFASNENLDLVLMILLVRRCGLQIPVARILEQCISMRLRLVSLRHAPLRTGERYEEENG
jgi:hypothetical protein